MQIMAGIEVLDDDIETAALADVLPADLAHRVAAPLTEFGLLTPEDLYECAANVGGCRDSHAKTPWRSLTG